MRSSSGTWMHSFLSFLNESGLLRLMNGKNSVVWGGGF